MKTSTFSRTKAGIAGSALVAATFGLYVAAPFASAAVGGDDSVTVTTSASSTTTSAAPTTTTAAGCLSTANIYGWLSYTFSGSTATITLKGTEDLCQPLHVRAAAYAFMSTTSQWPQHLVGFNDLTITHPGTFTVSAPARGCGQSDIYAGWTLGDVAVPDVMTTAGHPYEPQFIGHFAPWTDMPFTIDSVPCGTTTPPVTTTTVPPTTTTVSVPPTTTYTVPPTTTYTVPPVTTTATVPPVTTTATVPPTETTTPVPSVSGSSATNTTPVETTTATTTTPGASVSGVSETNLPTSTATNTPVPTETLPFTGGNVGAVAGVGALGILAGIALLAATRRPRRQ